MPLIMLFQNQQKILTQEHNILGKVVVDANTSELLEFLPCMSAISTDSQVKIQLKTASRLRGSSPITQGSDSDLSFPCPAPNLLASRLKLTPKWFCITALTLITAILPLELPSQRRISHSITENLFH